MSGFVELDFLLVSPIDTVFYLMSYLHLAINFTSILFLPMTWHVV